VLRKLPETLARCDVDATRPAVILANYGRLLRSRTFRGYMLVAASGFCGLFAFTVALTISGKQFLHMPPVFGMLAGLALLNLNGKMTELKAAFGLRDEDLDIDLGPLGRLR